MAPMTWNVVGVPSSVAAGTDHAKVREIFDGVSTQLNNANNDLRRLLHPHRCVDIMVAAFSAWERGAEDFRAGQAATGARWIKAR